MITNIYKGLIRSQSGMAALLTVVIICVASLIIVKNASFLGLGEIDMVYAYIKTNETLAITEGCAEEILRRYQLDSSFIANNLNLSLDQGTCVVNTVSNGNQRTINVQGNLDEYYKQVEVEITINNDQITIDRWEEISG